MPPVLAAGFALVPEIAAITIGGTALSSILGSLAFTGVIPGASILMRAAS